jgi:hypothetical protein
LTGPGATAGLTRANLAQRTLVKLQRGRGTSPDVLLVESDRGLVVVKDFAPRGRLRGWLLGRWLNGREARAYGRLAGHPSVPRLIGVLDSRALVVQHRGGTRFSRRRPWTFSPDFGRQLEEAVRGLHQRGVVHLDLRHRSNLRAAPDGRPLLLDFASAITFDPEGLGRRWLLPILARADHRALRKWRRRLGRIQPFEDAVAPGTASEGLRGARRPT